MDGCCNFLWGPPGKFRFHQSSKGLFYEEANEIQDREVVKSPPSFDSAQIPIIPCTVIAQSILPYVRDRRTWNSVTFSCHELHEPDFSAAGMLPPWPRQSQFKLDSPRHRSSINALTQSPDQQFLVASIHRHPLGEAQSSAPSIQNLNSLVWIHRQYGIQKFDSDEDEKSFGHTGRIWCLDISSDSRYLASGSQDQSILIWGMPTDSDIRTRLRRAGMEPVVTLTGHRSPILSVAFDPSHNYRLASGSFHRVVKVWEINPDAGEAICIHTLHGHGGIIRSLTFCGERGGSSLLVASGQNIHLWDLSATNAPRNTIIDRDLRERSCVTFLPERESSSNTATSRKVHVAYTTSAETTTDGTISAAITSYILTLPKPGDVQNREGVISARQMLVLEDSSVRNSRRNNSGAGLRFDSRIK